MRSHIGSVCRFPGQYHDRSTDLYYNQFRHYRPDLGRYMTPDPIGLAGGLNLYGYAGQNPINYVDALGLETFSCAETLKIIREAGEQNIFQALWNHTQRGKYDYNALQPQDKFTVGRELLDADEFGNYLAGYAGYKLAGNWGYRAVRVGGALYDFKDAVWAQVLGIFDPPRPPSTWDWDADSVPEINAGTIRAMLEEMNIQVDNCDCE